MNLQVEGGAYCFRIPTSFFPLYNNNPNSNPISNQNMQEYLVVESYFHYKYTFIVEINSQYDITYLSIPSNYEVVQASEN
jgi:hypothetical protein